MKHKIIVIVMVIVVIITGGYFIINRQDIIKSEKNIQTEGQVIQNNHSTTKSYSNNKEDILKKQLDILAIGNSDLYSGFNPMQLWKEQQYTCFVEGVPMLNMKLSYKMAKLAFQYYQPQLLLIEVDQFFDNREKGIEPEGYEYTARKYCYPLLEGSDEWENVKKEKYYIKKEQRMLYGGFYYNDTVKGYHGGFSYMNKNDKKTQMASLTKEYLPQLMSLAKENNCQVLFVWLPSETTATQKRHEAINQIAKKYNVPFIDFNVNQYDTGFDWTTDTRDEGNHLNYNGACKITKYLGEYIKENYKIENHHTQATLDRMNERYHQFIKYISQK